MSINIDRDDAGMALVILAFFTSLAILFGTIIAVASYSDYRAQREGDRYEVNKISACVKAGGVYHENAPGIPSTCERS